MLRGSQKQMIVVRTRNSRMFEEAYFVMRRGADKGGADELDMLWEANRIIESSLPSETRRDARFSDRRDRQAYGEEGGFFPAPSDSGVHGGLVRKLIWFATGLLTGGGAVSLLWWLL